MAKGGGSAEASIVFEKLLNDYLARHIESGKIRLYLKKLEALRKDMQIMEGVDVDDSGHVSLGLHNWDAETIVRDMSKVYDSLIEIDAFTKGGKTAFEEAKNSVMAVERQFEEPFSRLKINNYILRGSLRGLLPTGIEGMDDLLGGGIPERSMVLLLGPPGSEKFRFAYQFLTEGLKKGDAGLITFSSMSVDKVKSRLSTSGVNIPSCETKNILKFVDWYRHKSKHIIGMEEHGAVFIPSKDIANLDIALMTSMDKLEFSPTKRGVFDFITSALGMYNISEVTEFLQRQKTRLKKEEITSIFVVEQGAHDERVLSTLKHISDGVIILSKDEEGLFVNVESMDGGKFDPKKFAVQVSQKGIAVVGESVDETGIIAEFSTIPGIDHDIARNLVDAGFTDLEKLHVAERAELIEVKGISDDNCTEILEYLGSVEYSQRVLAKKSESWLNKGIEQAAANQVDKAMMSLQRALEIDYNNLDAWLELSKIHHKTGDIKESRKCLVKARMIDSSASAPWLEEA